MDPSWFPQDDVQFGPTAGAGEGLPANPLPRRVLPRRAGRPYRSDRSPSPSVVPEQTGQVAETGARLRGRPRQGGRVRRSEARRPDSVHAADSPGQWHRRHHDAPFGERGSRSQQHVQCLLRSTCAWQSVYPSQPPPSSLASPPPPPTIRALNDLVNNNKLPRSGRISS